jgi:hypothetical protein
MSARGVLGRKRPEAALGIIAIVWVLGTILTPLLRLLESASQRG